MAFAQIIESFSCEKKPGSEAELRGDIPADALTSYEGEALAHIAARLDLPGFRKGKVPPETARKKVGDAALMEEAVEMFMRDFYPELIATKHIEAVGRPHIQITKLAPGNPVSVVIHTAVYPGIAVPADWKAIAASVPQEKAEEATDAEVSETLESLRKNKQAAAGDNTPLPELDDAFAQSVGKFENLGALKEQIKKGITEEKARAARDKRRGGVIEKLLAESTVDVPRVFVESELDKIVAQMKEDISRMGLQFDDYMKRIGKTEDTVREEFKDQALKRAKLQLILNKLAEDEKVEADTQAVEAELKHALEHFPDADPARVRIHIETVLKNEKVLNMLEGVETAT